MSTADEVIRRGGINIHMVFGFVMRRGSSLEIIRVVFSICLRMLI